jgi:putative isomerase
MNNILQKFPKRYLLSYIIIFELFISCSTSKYVEQNLQKKYVDVLNIRQIPSEQFDLNAFGFSDMGAWHAYSLPNQDSTDYFGGFCGPLIMKNSGRWMGKKSLRLLVFDNKDEPVKWLKDSTQLVYFPGKLEQRLQSTNLKIKENLVFANNRTALITCNITNTSLTDLSYAWKLESHFFKDKFKIFKKNNQVFVYLGDSSFVCLTFKNDRFDLAFDSTMMLIIGKEKLNIKAGESELLAHTESYFFNEQELNNKNSVILEYLNNPEKVLSENSIRWNKYLKNILDKTNNYSDSVQYKRLAVKCVQTLISNWRSPAGALRHNGVFPSAAYQGFYGFWSWDSWKHASALALFNDDLAKESVRSMFDFQNKDGMIADCVYNDSTENNWRDTKPPLAAWAVFNIFQNTKDTDFVREIYPKLLKYHQWWYQFRDHNKNGICEYGSTDGTLIAAKWESGMDNAVRFDNSKILKNKNAEWSLNQESVDLNVFLQKEKEYLAKLAEVINKLEESELFEKEAEKLAKVISTYFWSEKSKYFMDYNFSDKKFVETYGSEGWLPLWAGIANNEQADEVTLLMLDTTRFNTLVPLPTLDRSDNGFDPLDGYWRGPVWIDQVYFGYQGLKNYNYNKEADIIKQKLFQNARGMLEHFPLYENYHPLTGLPLNAPHFSWTAAAILMMLNE